MIRMRFWIAVAFVAGFASSSVSVWAEVGAAPLGAALNEALAQLPSVEPSRGSQVLHALRAAAERSRVDSPERRELAARLLETLASPAATPYARKFSGDLLQLLGTEAEVPALEKLLDDDAVREIARSALTMIPGDAAAKALRGALERFSGDAKIGVVRSLGTRRDVDSVEALSKLATGSDTKLALAAAAALGAIGTQPAAEAVERALAAAPAGSSLVNVLLEARLQCAARLASEDKGELARAVYRRAWEGDGPAALRADALSGLARLDCESAAGLLTAALLDPDPEVRRAAARRIPGAAKILLETARDGDATLRLGALDGLEALLDPAAAEGLVSLLARATLEEEITALERVLTAVGHEMVDPCASVGLLSGAIAAAEPAARPSLLRLQEAWSAAKPNIERERAPAIAADLARALERDAKRSRAQKRALARRAPEGMRLAAYLDCGPDSADGRPGGTTLRLVNGLPHIWAGSAEAAEPRFATIFFDPREVVFEAAGLLSQKSYRVGFSWWDYDSNGRVESVWLSSGERTARVLEATALPGFVGKKEAPAEQAVAVPAEFAAGGTLRIALRNEHGPNAVVSEVWLWEAATAPESAQRDEGPLRVVIVTGQDYPGQLWRETAPVLASLLGKDPRLAVSVVDQPAFLATSALFDADVAVLHFMNWEQPDPGSVARANLARFAEEGNGVVLVHFACGAFRDWPGFRDLAGRVYDPALRPHDPRGPFHVEVTAKDHPVTAGLASFQTDDELYTCLAGERCIEVLATARSRVDSKDYPMAFVNTYGKGRVFHTPLGHDVRAFQNPGTAELIRRGCAWAGGIEPVVPASAVR